MTLPDGVSDDIEPTLSEERKQKIRAIFGGGMTDDSDLIDIRDELSEADRVETPDYRLKDVLEVGDWVTIQHQGGNVSTGPVLEYGTVGFNVEVRNRTAAGYFPYGDFRCEETDEKGIVNELIDINGEPADRVIERREREAGADDR